MSQVALVLHILRIDFMLLMREGSLLINNDNMHWANYIADYQSFLAPSEVVELKNISNVLQGLNVTSQEVATAEMSQNPNEVLGAQSDLDS